LSAADAFACVWLTTLGTATSAGPSETVSATALPVATLAPAAGFWLITDPAGTVALLALAMAPVVRPAAASAAEAFACVWVTTFGTATSAGPIETVSATALPVATLQPAAGF